MNGYKAALPNDVSFGTAITKDEEVFFSLLDFLGSELLFVPVPKVSDLRTLVGFLVLGVTNLASGCPDLQTDPSLFINFVDSLGPGVMRASIFTADAFDRDGCCEVERLCCSDVDGRSLRSFTSHGSAYNKQLRVE